MTNKVNFLIIILIILGSCTNSSKVNSDGVDGKAEDISLAKLEPCDYLDDFQNLGNRVIDTFNLDKGLFDPIDDFLDFEKGDFDFFRKDGRIYKKSKTYCNCNKKYIEVEYFQDLSEKIELSSYKPYDETYFRTKGKVFFWWSNSSGHLVLPINNADPDTFKPFKALCGGRDKFGVYYGCPNHGVYHWGFPRDIDFEFISKDDHYWNSPSHYVIIDNQIFDVKYELGKGYFCELTDQISEEEINRLRSKMDTE